MSDYFIYITGLLGLVCLGLGMRNFFRASRVDADSLVQEGMKGERKPVQRSGVSAVVRPKVLALHYTATIPMHDTALKNVSYGEHFTDEDLFVWKNPELQKTFGCLNEEIQILGTAQPKKN